MTDYFDSLTSLTEGGEGIPRLRARRGDEGIAPYGRVQGARCWTDRVVRPYE